MNRVELSALNGSVIAQRTDKAYRSKTNTRPTHNKSYLDIYHDRVKVLKELKQ